MDGAEEDGRGAAATPDPGAEIDGTSGALTSYGRATTIVGLVAFPTESPDAARAWLGDRIDRLRAVEEVEEGRVVSAGSPSRAGLALRFATGEAYERFCHEHLPELRRAMGKAAWSAGRPLQGVMERTR